MLIDIYIKGLKTKFGHFPSKEELKKDMEEQQNVCYTDKGLPYGDRTIKFYLKIGRTHEVKEQSSFNDIEDRRRQLEMKES